MAKANEKKVAKKTKGETPEVHVDLEAPVKDPGRAPREDAYGRKERQTEKEDINAREEGKDRVYGVSSRARWGGDDDIAELSADAQAAEQSANENRE